VKRFHERSYPEIERAGRFVYHVRVRTELGPDGFPSVVTDPPAWVLGARWARWKARRMLRAELRRNGGREADPQSLTDQYCGSHLLGDA
jgi:hypothetical protein